MLSYQHAYHAGNLADVHKHAVLAMALAYIVSKDKPISYLETHAGRGLYDLSSKEAAKTGEAEQGVARVLERFPIDHPYRQTVEAIRQAHGQSAYPGSPLVAAHFQRKGDRLQLAELHPQEHTALVEVMPRSGIHIYKEDGFPWAARVCPPTPRRGLMLIDPSYELAHDYPGIPPFLQGLHSLWPVGVIMLWYPILQSGEHLDMLDELDQAGFPDPWRHEVHFSKAGKSHRLEGSGLFVINTPYLLPEQAEDLDTLLKS